MSIEKPTAEATTLLHEMLAVMRSDASGQKSAILDLHDVLADMSLDTFHEPTDALNLLIASCTLMSTFAVLVQMSRRINKQSEVPAIAAVWAASSLTHALVRQMPASPLPQPTNDPPAVVQ